MLKLVTPRLDEYLSNTENFNFTEAIQMSVKIIRGLNRTHLGSTGQKYKLFCCIVC